MLLFVSAEDYHSASTPLKSGVRIYRRLAAADGGSSWTAVNCGSQRRRTCSQINTLRAADAGQSDAVSGGLKTTACIDAKPENSDRRVCPLADDVKVNDKETVCIRARV